MNRREFALVALARAGSHPFTPVQLQKYLFILDRKIGDRVGGTGFEFRPYHYGPFDAKVYATLDCLRNEGLADISEATGAHRTYQLTDRGHAEGEEISRRLERGVTDYMGTVGDFVRSQSFAGLVSSIYRAYPEMKVNSVFQE